MNKLKKILIYFFILFLIFPSEVEHVVTFIPNFISHYQHHNEEHHSLSFVEFILEHTAEEEHETGNHKQDSCPINHDHAQVNISLALVDPSISEQILPTYIFNEKKEEILDKNKSISSVYLSSIWQPPKFC